MAADVPDVALVGEHGLEPVRLPPGTQVLPVHMPMFLEPPPVEWDDDEDRDFDCE